MDPAGPGTFHLLTRHFIRRFLDNDLLSADVDRRESAALVCALIGSLGVFATFFISLPYLVSFIQLPGATALSALSDRFQFVAASMAFAALAALSVWEALALESRDLAILGPLPIDARTIARAKLCAALLVGAAVVGVLNVVPSILYPAFLIANLRSVGFGGLFQLVAAHAATTIMAGLCAFLSVLASRGILRTTLGERWFPRISSLVQSVLVAATTGALLLAPTARPAAVTRWIADSHAAGPVVSVPLWFVGLQEATVGHVVADAPIAAPGHLDVARRWREQDGDKREAYRRLSSRFSELAWRALFALPLAAVAAISTFLWNNRRFPDRPTHGRIGPRNRPTMANGLARLASQDREAQAGFFFTLQVLTRSGPHRMILAISVAASAALGFLAIIAGSVTSRLALQTVVLLPLLVGFRQAVLVPTEITSNWVLQMAWLGDERGYLAGVRRAGTAALILLPLALLLPIHIFMFGIAIALAHFLYGLLFAIVVLEAIFLTYRRLPFACSYIPIENPKLVWPVGVVLCVSGAVAFANLERFAVQTMWRQATVGACLVAIATLVKLVDHRQRRERVPIDFHEKPALPTQRLDLSERVALRDS